MAASAITIGKTVQQRRWRGGQRDFDLEDEDIIGDSGHLIIGTK